MDINYVCNICNRLVRTKSVSYELVIMGECPQCYSQKILDRESTIKAILSLNPVLKRKYLATKTLDTLHDLKESLLLSRYETP